MTQTQPRRPHAAPTPRVEVPKLEWLDRAQPVLLVAAVAVGLGWARMAPGVAEAVGPLVSIGVFALIFLVMLGVDVKHVAHAFRNPRFLTIAVVINFVVNPLMAWGLATVFLSGHPDLFAGLILFLVTPCIGWYLIFTEHAGGDTEVGVSLLAINVVLQIMLLPLYVFLLAGDVVGVDLATVASSVAGFLVGPLALAALVRRSIGRTETTLERVQQRLHLPYVKTAVLMLIIIAMFASQADTIYENPGVFSRLVGPITLFFVLAFAIAVGVGRVTDMPYEQRALLVFTTTSRNSEASLAIAATVFASPLVPLTVVIGPVIELPLLVVMVRLLLRYRRDDERPDDNGVRTPRCG